MVAKFDKEVLIKHHFWILSGVFLLLALIPLLLLATSVSARVNRASEMYKSEAGKVSGIKDPKNKSWIDAYHQQDIEIEKKKIKLWQDAWETQKDLMTFPASMTDTFKGKYF